MSRTRRDVEAEVLRRVRRDGLLIFTDPRFPSVVTLVAGTSVHGSWFAHPAAHEIYRIGELLEHHPDILVVPLLERKATLVHRSLWAAVVSVAASRGPWQLDALSAAERELLRRTEEHGSLDAGEEAGLPLARGRSRGDAARGLERRLLVYGRSEHTPSGRHTKLLESWSYWKERVRFGEELPAPARARAEIVERLDAQFPPGVRRPRLPWERVARAGAAEPGLGQ